MKEKIIKCKEETMEFLEENKPNYLGLIYISIGAFLLGFTKGMSTMAKLDHESAAGLIDIIAKTHV